MYTHTNTKYNYTQRKHTDTMYTHILATITSRVAQKVFSVVVWRCDTTDKSLLKASRMCVDYSSLQSKAGRRNVVFMRMQSLE